MQPLNSVRVADLGISDEDLGEPVAELRIDVDNPTAVQMVLCHATQHLRPAAKSQLLAELGLPAVPGAVVDLGAISPDKTASALFSAFLAEAMLVALEPAPLAPALPE